MKMNNTEENLGKAWIEYAQNFWAYDELDKLCRKDPASAISIISYITNNTDDDSILSHLSSGPVESMLAKNGTVIIDRVEELCSLNPNFKKCVKNVWRNTITQDVWDRIQHI
jgi:hypothetical protein